MSDALLAALASADLNPTIDRKDVWTDRGGHDPSVNGDKVGWIEAEFRKLLVPKPHNPLGKIVLGGAGSGKSHLLSELRRRVWADGGWFVYVDALTIRDFWKTMALAYRESLDQRMDDGRSQAEHLVHRLVALSVPKDAMAGIMDDIGSEDASRVLVAASRVRNGLAKHDRTTTLDCRDALTALITFVSGDLDMAFVGHAWLMGEPAPEGHPPGLFASQPGYERIVTQVNRLMALAGPSLVAVDQIDALIGSISNGTNEGAYRDSANSLELMAALATLSGGLMSFHNSKERTLVVMSCIDGTFAKLQTMVEGALFGRFDTPEMLTPTETATRVMSLMDARLAPAYAAARVVPPYPTYPFSPGALAQLSGRMPREILVLCDRHRKVCMQVGKVTEITNFPLPGTPQGPPLPTPPGPTEGPTDPPQPQPAGPDPFVQLLADYRSKARIDGLLDKEEENTRLRNLLVFACRAYAREQVSAHLGMEVSAPSGPKPALHAKLHIEPKAPGGVVWSIRGISQSNAIAFRTRVKEALLASGIADGVTVRELVIVRSGSIPTGAATAASWQEMLSLGGIHAVPDEDSLRTLIAVSNMAAAKISGLGDWMARARPVSSTTLFREMGLGPGPAGVVMTAATHADVPTEEPPSRTAQPSPGVVPPVPRGDQPRTVSPVAPALILGVARTADGDQDISLPPSILPRHIAIMGGSGSGKTVLLRRVIEEAALCGLPAIVLDSNNDLARLGEPWPTNPDGWTETDVAKSQAYQAKVDVALWTPGRSDGRPISLPLLPNFEAVRSDAEETNQAIQLAIATLAPIVNAQGDRNRIKRGVLAGALEVFARRGRTVGELVDLLRDLPEGTTNVANPSRYAADMADNIVAYLATDPTARGSHTVDIADLFASRSEGRVRISVINFAGIPGDEQRQTFVNALQMALFTWIKAHPSPTGRLFAMDEAQNFAPSGSDTPCRASTKSLAAQARKYGLGMVFATQSPKGIDNNIVSNCATHFYGKQNSPNTIAAAEDMLAGKGGQGLRVGTLGPGKFYLAADGGAKPRLFSSKLCLSYHPANPLTSDEIIALARRQT